MNGLGALRLKTRNAIGAFSVEKLAVFGGRPVVPQGRVTPWPAAQNKHLDAVRGVVDGGRYHRVHHPIVSDLEQNLARWAGKWQVRAVGSGTAAIHIELDYVKERGEQVVTAALNWPGAVGPITISGLQPVFVDVDMDLAGIDQWAAAERFNPNVAAVLVTHLFGNNVLVPDGRSAARAQGISVIDDICQSIGAAKPIVGGAHLDADALALSGSGAKHLGAGELGFVITEDANLIAHVDRVSLSSSSRSGARIFSPYSQGYNYRPNVFSSSIAKLRVTEMDTQLQIRRDNSKLLWEMISELVGIFPLFNPSDCDHSMLNFPLRIEPAALGFAPGPAARDFVVKSLQAEGVPICVWLTKPVFEYLPDICDNWKAADFPNTMKLLDTVFCVSEIAPPNDGELMELYAEAFHKVWNALHKQGPKVAAGATSG
ncbi:DegT/DnrJ/EryC1/StrS family aminotransferase [Rhizobium ruizarguesonis]|uniref:DegT/DnrJ/EryC1/StrS family aminotransferase n=1 Tax=Rhizobium ruizarguesonis TaxID=2081791 RepID=UPI001040BD32|nr:DegT/DnrJ/EryC1/StrS family aminotransferase [Rhizobium ruizarguesonis]MBY5834658.1 DegT/DnrJ/EryC1/StrS aminotransferase family protein [Rhizobium leguminosarum]TBY89629.1 DegT/DnrJ/EryC1/StrS aminotransferase family protein [Rhizobium leguminosarum bv. viciae]MBY5847946.1 DegT/DnrJ/EryC1/StrS aminotransferase family protein [Rhizobium leguminosarum]MBY5855061.1 DegT/DnrJ/EryC1/StrS aminotransferase family protein [Rhizobium leguminosarum]MBY5862905.1 DegT/DnrJ/EryC1/StrS aminotransferase 